MDCSILAAHSVGNGTDPIVPFPPIPIPMPIVPAHCPNSHPNPNAQSHIHPNAHCPIPMPIDHCQKRKFSFSRKLIFMLHKFQKKEIFVFTKIEICVTQNFHKRKST